MIGAGVLIQALTGIDFALAVIGTGILHARLTDHRRHAHDHLGADHQGRAADSRGDLTPFSCSPKWGSTRSSTLTAPLHPDGEDYLAPGLGNSDAISGISFGLALLLGTAGLPHILVRFFTVPDARAILGQGAVEAGAGGNPAATLLAEELGGGKGTTGVISSCPPSSAVAFATILAVVAGLVIASGAMAHDLWTSVVRKGQADEKEEISVARIAVLGLGAVAIGVSILGGESFNVSILIGLAFAVAASTNLPALLFALFWRSPDRRSCPFPRASCSAGWARFWGGSGERCAPSTSCMT